MIEKKGAMFISPSSAYPDPSQLYEALFGKTALRNAGGVELPGFRELLDATMEAQDQATRKAAFVKLQRFVVEQAMQMVQFISPTVQRRQPEGEELPGQPAGGAEIHRGLAAGLGRGCGRTHDGRRQGIVSGMGRLPA